MDRMRSRPDSALSETIATTLIIILVVALAAIIAALIMGIPLLPNKPVLAAFSASVVMGANTSSAYGLNVPTIQLDQMAGDPLVQEFATNTHSTINGTKIKIIDPTGKMITVVSAISLRDKTIRKGKSYYIFHYTTGETNEYWLTNDPSRVFTKPPTGSGVLPFSPHGKWRLVITEEKDTNMVLYQKDLNL
jgi:hypothetical protein